MLNNGWLLAKYNKSGSYALLDPENPTPEGVHTIQNPNLVRQVPPPPLRAFVRN